MITPLHPRRSRAALALILGLPTLAACEPPPAVAPPSPTAAPEPPPATTAAQVPQKTRYDVIIVGAGLAGITAAKALRDAHASVLVLEATNRIGGRGITTESLGKGTFSAPIDLGGAWIHNVNTNPLTPIIAGGGWTTERTHVDASKHFFFAGHFADGKAPLKGAAARRDKACPLGPKIAGEPERERFKDAYESFEKDLETALEKGDDAKGEGGKIRSAASVLEANCKVRALPEALRRLIALNAGPLESTVELSQSSIEDSAEFLAGEDDFLHAGFGAFVEAFGEDVRPLVKLNEPVDKIAITGDGVVVSSGADRFEGRKALVTVSTGVLAAGKIAFDPPLDEEKREAIHDLPMGVLDKVILEFNGDPKAIFPTDDDRKLAPGQEPETLANTWVLYGGKDGKEDLALVLQPMGSSIAVGFFGGDRAKELEDRGEAGRKEMRDVAVQALTAMCKASRPAKKPGQCDVEHAVKRVETTAWHTTPWTLGAYSAARPGKAHMREVLAAPIGNKVYFAGEATYNATYNGSFPAAYASALRASRAIAACLARADGDACAWLPMVARSAQHLEENVR